MDITIGANGYNVRPLNYSISNNSTVSSAYIDSVKKSGNTANIRATAPVKYPNAQLVPGSLEAAKSIEANKAYNQIASSFGSAVTAYDKAGAGTGYGLLGSQFDTYA